MTEKYQILEPLSSMVELALLNFSEDKPKITIKNHGINIDVPGNGIIPQCVSRYLGGDSKEDIYILNSMIINYIEWFIINNYNDKFDIYKNIALCAVSGMRKLQQTYKTGIAVLSLQYYIILIMKSISDMEAKRKIPKHIKRKKIPTKLNKNTTDTEPHEETNKGRVTFLPKFTDDSSNEPDNSCDILSPTLHKFTDDISGKTDNNCSDPSILSNRESIDSEFQDHDDENNETEFKPKSELEVSRILNELGNVADDVGNRDDSSFLTENKIISESTLELWTIPMKQAQTIVDITKIKEIWSSDDVDDLYKMIEDCFDMTNGHHFAPKSGDFINARINALIEVLKLKDNNFSNIIRCSYGGII